MSGSILYSAVPDDGDDGGDGDLGDLLANLKSALVGGRLVLVLLFVGYALTGCFAKFLTGTLVNQL